MATEKQIEANRRNAQLSTGPKTEEGKKVSRLNALRHGLTAQIEVTSPDEKEAKDNFFAGIISSLEPEGAMEIQLAHSIADGHWRLNRASSLENNVFTLACSFQDDDIETENPEVEKALGAARVFIADPSRFQLLTIYEGRLHRNMAKNLRLLHELQAARRARETEAQARREQALEEARLLAQLDEREGITADPGATFNHHSGFVFSNAEIARSIHHFKRLKAAQEAFVPRPAVGRSAKSAPEEMTR